MIAAVKWCHAKIELIRAKELRTLQLKLHWDSYFKHLDELARARDELGAIKKEISDCYLPRLTKGPKLKRS